MKKATLLTCFILLNLLHVNAQIGIEWEQTYGGSSSDNLNSTIPTSDGGYLLGGETNSNDGDIQSGNHGGKDYWVAKLCTQTPLLIEITNPDYCYTTELVAIGDFDSYLWNTGETTQSITISFGGHFAVTAINENGCPTEAMIDAPYPLEPYNQSEICMITLDEETDKNILIYEPVQGVGIDSMMFYKLNNQTSQYDWIGSNSIVDEGIFIDQYANPSEQSHQYKIGVRDTCGKTSGLSPVHRTILLQANMGINDEVNLFWNPYEGFEYSNFGIYRSSNQGEYILISNVPNNIYTFIDLYPPAGEKKYQIRIEKDPPCNPDRELFSFVASNQIVFEPGAINEKVYDGIEIYPNPFNNNLIIERRHKLTKIKVEIIDVYGRLLESFDIEKGEAQKTISTEHLKQGVYYLRFDKIRSQSIIKQ